MDWRLDPRDMVGAVNAGPGGLSLPPGTFAEEIERQLNAW